MAITYLFHFHVRFLCSADLGDYEPESFITHLEGQSLFPCVSF